MGTRVDDLTICILAEQKCKQQMEFKLDKGLKGGMEELDKTHIIRHLI